MTTSAWRRCLAEYDGRDTAPLRRAASLLEPDPATVTALCELASESSAHVQDAATWVLKHFADDVHRYAARESTQIVKLLDRVTSWGATLHVVQLIPALTITAARKDATLRALLTCVDHDKPFVRAWAYHALACLADHFDEHRTDVRALIARAGEREKASVLARIRNTRKTYPWTIRENDDER